MDSNYHINSIKRS